MNNVGNTRPGSTLQDKEHAAFADPNSYGYIQTTHAGFSKLNNLVNHMSCKLVVWVSFSIGVVSFVTTPTLANSVGHVSDSSVLEEMVGSNAPRGIAMMTDFVSGLQQPEMENVACNVCSHNQGSSFTPSDCSISSAPGPEPATVTLSNSSNESVGERGCAANGFKELRCNELWVKPPFYKILFVHVNTVTNRQQHVKN